MRHALGLCGPITKSKCILGALSRIHVGAGLAPWTGWLEAGAWSDHITGLQAAVALQNLLSMLPRSGAGRLWQRGGGVGEIGTGHDSVALRSSNFYGFDGAHIQS